MRRWRISVCCGVVGFVFLGGPAPAAGQSPAQASFFGTITDISGGRIDGAVLKLERLDRPAGVVVVNAEKGKYLVPPLPDGDYSLEATAPGFLTVKHYPLRVRFPEIFQFDFSVHVGWGIADGVGDANPFCRFFGALRRQEVRVANATVCLIRNQRASCSITNSLGQYFVRVIAGSYEVKVEENGLLKSSKCSTKSV
ncbi:carboxypeptidase regulatory-like domain-containing protein [Paludibaculum fermentans]|uniref:carboxypeptidase-like regulatory domain-containing protein n=1 Tax=Paludibaculum fermentans TaxID=1473598 RepID=UPI003EB89E1D